MEQCKCGECPFLDFEDSCGNGWCKIKDVETNCECECVLDPDNITPSYALTILEEYTARGADNARIPQYVLDTAIIGHLRYVYSKQAKV